MLNLLDETYVLSMTELISEKTDKEDISELKKLIKDNKISGNSIKTTIAKFLSHSPDSLASDIPTIMDIITTTIIVGVPMAINPIIGIPVIIANKVIRDAADAHMIGRYISQYNLQIEHAKKKLEKEENSSKKVFWKNYIEKLQDGRDIMMAKKEDLRYDEGDSVLAKEINEAIDILQFEYDRLSINDKALLLDEETMLDDIDEQFLVEANIIKDAKMKTKQVVQKVERKAQAMDKWFNDTLKEIRNNNRNARRDEIVENNYPKLSKMIKRAIALGAIATVLDPTLAAISVVVGYTIKKKGDFKEKRRLLSELNKELEIVEAKIQDAESSGDRKEKYQLMRLRQKLKTGIDRVKGSI